MPTSQLPKKGWGQGSIKEFIDGVIVLDFTGHTGGTGIGDLITYHRSVAEYADMYAAVFSIIAVAAVTVGLLEKAETRYFRPETKTSKP